MATIAKPNVQVTQEFTPSPVAPDLSLRALIAGGNAYLHRYTVADEKAEIGLGDYVRDADTAYDWPGRHAGGVVDTDSVRLFADSALLLYLEDLIADTGSGKGTVTPVAGKKNRVLSSAITFKANTGNNRSSLLKDRDVRLGDRVYLRGVYDPDDSCEVVELWSYVAGFAAESEDGLVGAASNDENNATSATVGATITQVSGPVNCIEATADGAAYDGLADGYPAETYTIEVVTSSVSGCNAARLRVTSASGTDDADEVVPADFGEATDIGSRGLTVTFSDNPGNCSLSASSAGVAVAELTVGQKWQVTVGQDWEAPCVTPGGTYDGAVDDIYIIEVTKGGVWADLPEITVTTTKGLDRSGPTTVEDANDDVTIGTHGVTIRFTDCYSSNSSQASHDGETFGGDSTVAGLNLGDKFYVTVTTGADGPIRTLILKHDLPPKLLTATDLDLRLFIVTASLEISQDRVTLPPFTNFDSGDTQITVNSDITVYDSTWTDDGERVPLPLFAGDLYVQYREWLPTLATEINFIDDTADLDDIPGQLHPDNPLKWGVYWALLNSNGVSVGYISVADPADTDSWGEVLERTDGRTDVYNLVPLTHNATVLDLFKAHVLSESSAESGAWKGVVVAVQITDTKMIVGQSSEAVQALTPTSTDGGVVLATIEDDPDADGTQYTLLSVPAGNSNFLTYEVAAGDKVRFLFSIDAFGNETYSEFLVDEVLSENSLRLLTGPSRSVAVAQRMEIWRALSKTQIAADLADQAQSYANRRVIAVFPDLVGAGTETVDGMFLGCVYAGLASGVEPHQPLTNSTFSGPDDTASRTTNYFSETQLETMASGGIMIFTEDRDGTPYIRHALTTDVSDIAHREESQRRNLDSISYYFKSLLEPYIGRANVTSLLLDEMRYIVDQAIRYLMTNIPSSTLGPRLISGQVHVDSTGAPVFRQHPLNADTVEIVLDLVLPAPLNYVQLRLVV